MAQLPLPMTDDSLMPFGKYKGKKMGDVPDYYLMWLWNNVDLRDPLKTYISNNMDAIEANIKSRQAQKDAGK